MPPASSFPAAFPCRRDWWLLAAGVLFLYLFCLGTRGLNEPDEGRYAEMGRTMIQAGGDWWEPRLSGYGHYDKPPLVYWTTALSFRAFGLDEWAARVTPLFGALAGLAGLAWAAVRLRGERIAWWAVLICATSMQFWIMGRVLSPDMLLTGWCSLAVGAWAECRHRGGAVGYWLLSLAFWTLAWWTKATPALIPLAGVAAGTWLTGDVTGRRALRLDWLLPAILLLGAPWYLSMLHRYPELRGFFFGRELAGRMAGRVDGRHGAIFYYIPISIVAWLPWWPVAAWAAWRERARHSALNGMAAVRAWFTGIGVEGWIVVVGLLIFSCAASKLPTYSLTLAPWAALMMARCIAHLPGAGSERRPTRWLLVPAGTFALVALGGVIILPLRYESRLGVNASMRPVCEFIRAHSAGVMRVDADHYWAGMEFYLSEAAVRYVIHIDAPGDNDPLSPGVEGPPARPRRGRDEHHHERASDPGIPPRRFIDPVIWASEPQPGERWLVKFRRNGNSAFTDAVANAGNVTRIGDFDLYHFTQVNKSLVPASTNP